MSLAILKQKSYSIAKNAFIGTFIDSRDENGVIEKFANTWSNEFSLAVQKYVGMCIGIYPGGPVTPASTSTLKQDIYKAAKNALKATYLSNDYDNKVENDFADSISQVHSIIGSYMDTVQTILGVYPIFMSPGGPLIATASSMCTPVFNTSAIQAMLNTFQKGDVGGVATRFANIWQQHGLLIGEYVMTCTSLPGGGQLIAS